MSLSIVCLFGNTTIEFNDFYYISTLKATYCLLLSLVNPYWVQQKTENRIKE